MLLFTSCTPVPSTRDISDAALLQYSSESFDKEEMMDKHVVLGRNHGIIVVADFPCSDICPMGTARVIHYEVPLSRCSEIGGVEQGVRYGMVMARYCLPKVLADKHR